MPNPKVRTLTIGGVTYDLQDNISGYITGITSSDVTTALGFTPYNATNPNGYTSNTGTITSVKTTAGTHTTIDVSSGAANFNVPTKTSHLTNDSGFLTSYTETDPTVPAWAKAENKPSYNFSEIGSKPTTISGYGITDTYTKTEVDGLVSGVLHYKGTKATVANLPNSDNTIGDVWHVTADGSEWAWDGSTWQELGTAVDLSGYLLSSEISSWAKQSTKPSYALSEITGATDVQAIEALIGTSGFLKKIAADTWALDTNTYLTSASTLDASKLSGAIPSTITGTTQSSTDNSTKLATTAFVQSVISGIDTEEVHMVTITATYDSETDTTTFSLNNTYQEISGWINDGDVVVLQDSVGLYSYYFTSDGSGEYYFTSVTGDYFIISSSNIEYISDYYVFQSDLADYITSSELANYAQFTDIADYISSELANYAQLTDIDGAVFNYNDSVISSEILPWVSGEDFGYIRYRDLTNDKTASISYGVFGSGNNYYSSIALDADKIKLITSGLQLTSDNNHYVNISIPNLTNDITLTLPNTTGTIALTSDIPIVPSITGSNTTSISIADHSTTEIYGVSSSTASVTGVSGSTSVYGVKSGTNSTTTASKASGANGTASTWTFEEKSVPNVTAVGSGSLTFTMDSTDTKKLIISHTHTAPTLGTAIKIQSKSSGSNGSASTWSFTDVTVPIRADSATTVPTAASSATTVPIKNDTATTVVTSKTHSVTDTGHTHTI